MSQEIRYHNKKEMLDAMAEDVLLPINFVGIGESYVGDEPLKSKSSFLDWSSKYVNFKDVVTGLSLAEQLYLNDKVSKRFGLKIRHGNLKENLMAAYSRNTQNYYRNVLEQEWVFTGEVIRRVENKYEELILKPSNTS